MRRIPRRLLAVAVWGLLLLSGRDGVSAPTAPGSTAPYQLQLIAMLKPTTEAGSVVTVVKLQIRTVAGSPPTVANKVQLKSEEPSTGETYWVKNITNVPLVDVVLPGSEVVKECSFEFTDLSRRMPLSAQVNIKSEDSTKGEILRANTLVLLCPDLRTGLINAPSAVGMFQPVDIRVVVFEQNGDLGARFDVAVLDESGQELDRCTGVSVGPSDSATAVLSIKFSTLGSKHLTTRILNSDPEEANTSNNEGSLTITVAPVTARWEWWVDYNDYRLDDYYSFTEVKQPTGSWHTEFENHGFAQWADMTARAPVPMAWPWNFTGTLRLDGADQIQVSRSGILPDVSEGDPAAGGVFFGSYRGFDPETQADITISVYSSGADDGSSYSLAELHQLATDYVQYSSGYYNNWYGSTYNWTGTGLIRQGALRHATQSIQGLVGLTSQTGSFGGWSDAVLIAPFADHHTSSGSSVRFDPTGARIDTTFSSTINEEGHSAFGYGVSNP